MAENNNSNNNFMPNSNGMGNNPPQNPNANQNSQFNNNPQFNGQNANSQGFGQQGGQPNFQQGQPQQPQFNQQGTPSFQQRPPQQSQFGQQGDFQQRPPQFNPSQNPQMNQGAQFNRPNNPQMSQQNGYQQNMQQPQFNQQQGAGQTQNQAPQNPNQSNPNNPNNIQQPNQNKAGFENKKTLSEEDKERLRKLNRNNVDIKKLKKRSKKPILTENARPLYKVRRLYSAKLSHKMYYEKMLEIAKLRALANEGGKKGAALIGGAVKKTRNLVATILIVFAILAVVGTGTFVTLTMLNKDTTDYNFTGQLTIKDQEQVEEKIDNYELGKDINIPISVLNSTGQNIILRFYVEMKPNTYLQDAVDNGELDFSKLVLSYNFNDESRKSSWYFQEVDGIVYMYYIGQLAINSSLTIIDGYKIDLAPGESNHDDWIKNNYGVEVTFYIQYYSAQSIGKISEISWPQEWKNEYTKLYPEFA